MFRKSYCLHADQQLEKQIKGEHIMKNVIETHNLCKSYHGRIVVDNLNLNVPQGSVYSFIGPNCAGKSTSMKMLLGLTHPRKCEASLHPCRNEPEQQC